MNKRHLYTNRLIKEKSPYLLQHAHNPVDWYPWGEEAFSAARLQDKPIFLSIGYATCHWCHVMEQECFESNEIAQLMNDSFICVKVDREELPEVDNLYMEFAQSMIAGAAGWPLNLILTPHLEPFFAATYLPPYSSQGLTGLSDLITHIKELWNSDERDHLMAQAEHIVDTFAEHVHLVGDSLPEREFIDETAEMLFKLADPVYGGVKGAPKFPIGYHCNFLLHYASVAEDSRSLFLAERTLDMMQRGGIYDHLGGGFSRYSVDEEWLVPHFEKMLYDNALLAHSYLEMWKISHHELHSTICHEILDYILRDMTHPEGGFYSAEDADSEGHEGYFYTWTKDEIEMILGKEESALFCEFYQVTSMGNFEGRSILHTPLRADEFAKKHNLDPQEFANQMIKQRHILWKVRETREHPFKDDKILSAWNGLMIFSMTEAGAAFQEPRYIDAASKAASFIHNHLWKDGALLRRWRDGEALHQGTFDDYAFIIRGVLSLFEVTGKSHWLSWAMEMTNLLSNHFKAENGAFYQTDGQDPNIILRKSQFSDGAEPSGNAIHCENLLRLYQMTLDSKYLQQAEEILKAAKKYIDNYSPGYCYHMINLMRYYDKKMTTAVIAFNEDEEYQQELEEALFTSYHPHRTVIWKRSNDTLLTQLIPFMEKKTPIDKKTTLYLCRQGACEEPLNDLTAMLAALN